MISRIIKLSNGHALLVGEGGSGRHSLTRIASFLENYRVFQVAITKNYGSSAFKKDMQTLFGEIAVEGDPHTFLFSDNEIIEEGIIEDVNNILSLGEIPNLYNKKEGKDKLKKFVQKENDEIIYDYFVQQIQSNLHLVF